MDYGTIRKLAEKRAAASAYVQNLGMMNSAIEPEKRIAQDAQYRLANDAFTKADGEYQDAMSSLTADQLNELVHTRNQNSV